MKEQLVTAHELAAHFRVKLPTVRLWTRQGVPVLKAGRLSRFRPEEVETWLRGRTEKITNSEKPTPARREERGNAA